MEDACREYQSSLEDLTFNSKPHINMLTILAEENLTFAKDIVAIIEAQISQAPAAEKLPVLYLVDSIVKNVGGEYLAVFAKNLITSFICVFDKVDENTRKSLFKLRSTWDEVFPLKKLYALDVRVNAQDPAWPIKPLPPTVNASIHVNPKFLKQSEEASSPQPAPAPAPVPAPVPAPAAVAPAKEAAVAPAPAPPPAPGVSPSSVTQEQLIRQQLLAKQKQLLELQQKKIELELEQTKAQLAGGFSLPTMPQAAALPKPVNPTVPVVRPWIPAPTQAEAKSGPTRDPRLNRAGPPGAPQPKEQRDGAEKTASPAPTPEKRPADKSLRADRSRTPRKELEDDKSKSPSPLAKGGKAKGAEPGGHRASDAKKDPRLKKRPPSGEAKDPEVKEKRRNTDKKERAETGKGKLANGSVGKRDEPEFKSGGNARTHARKRTRSRSPGSSPKRKERRSPKSRTRSSSPSPPHKPGKPRRPRPDDKPGRDERGGGAKKSQSDGRGRSKRPTDELQRRDDLKEAPPHRWRSGWDEGKHVKPSDDDHLKPSALRHKQQQQHGGGGAPPLPARPPTPRTPKHRLSVDANLQIPEVLNSASKKDLLRRAGKRLESGEISQEEFLNMAHQIKHFFQYQEEKQQRSDPWDDQQATPPSPQPRPPPGAMDAAELSYLEHKSKLRKTQVAPHRAGGEEADEDDGTAPPPGDKAGAAHKYSRRAGERRSKEREEPRPSLGPMIEEYNHGKEFPPIKALQGLRFRRRTADPRGPSEREWTSPLTERQREEQRSGYDAPRRFGPPEAPRADGAPPPSRKCPSPSGADGPRFERERLSPLHLKEAELSPVPTFESPNSEHSDEGPLNPEAPPPHAPPKSILKAAQRAAALQHGASPGHTPPHEPGLPPPHYEGPEHAGPPRGPHPSGWFEDSSHFEGPGRFEGGGRPPQRFEGPEGPRVSHGPMRSGMGGRFEGHAHPPGPGRFDGPVGQQPPVRFGGQGPGHFEGPPAQHFEHPRRFDAGVAPGPMGFSQRFEGPQNQMGPMRFAGPGQPRYDMPGMPHHFEGGQQGGGGRFNMQAPMRPLGPPVFDPQQNFPLGPQCFPSGPMSFSAQPGNFGLQPPFSGPAPFYSPAPPQPQVTLMGNMNRTYLPQTSLPFGPQAPQVVPPENHFGQVDVNDLLTKLISTGIIKPSAPDAAAPAAAAEPGEPAAPPLAGVRGRTVAPPPEEEEEEEQEEQEDDSLPDLTGFVVERMKHRLEPVVTRLYSGNQCCLCSMRFTAAQTDLYADHLDWHFRQNHQGKMANRKVTHRRWYYSLTDWIEFEEIADLEERAKSHFFEKENEEEVQKKNQAAAKEEVQSVRATKDQVGESCEICQEAFETNWVEEEEDWFLKDALRLDTQLFHPSCFEDYKKTSAYPDVTPSPSKVLSEHPLSALVKEEETPPTSCCAGKQEVMSDASQLLEVKKEEEAEPLKDLVQSEESKE